MLATSAKDPTTAVGHQGRDTMETTRGVFGVFTRYLGPTQHRGARVKATAPSGRSITVAWDYALDVAHNHEAAARALCGLLCEPHGDGTDVAKGRCLRVLTPEDRTGGDYAVFVFPDAKAKPWSVPVSGGVTP